VRCSSVTSILTDFELVDALLGQTCRFSDVFESPAVRSKLTDRLTADQRHLRLGV
jgi:hypothetical protein